MGSLDNWDITLLVVAGYIAIAALVRLMARRRDQMLDEFRRQIAEEQKNGRPEEKGRKSA